MSEAMSLQGRRPFLATPDPSRYFPASGAEDARLRLERSVLREEGPGLLIGGNGCGKTLLLHVLSRQFDGQLRVALLPGSQLCTRRSLLQMILFELGQSYRAMDESELRLGILRYLKPETGGPRRLLLLVDEADALPTRLLEDLRGLANLAVQGRPLVHLVLAGGTRLEERFAEPELQAFSQRIAARCYLAPWGREETRRYVQAQVAAVGLDPSQLLAADALEAIFEATDGVPRLVNQLGNQLFWIAAAKGADVLDADLVQEAWSELQQLPAPWNVDSPTAPQGTGDEVVEFADFDDFDSAGSAAGNAVREGDRAGDGDLETGDDDDGHPASIPFSLRDASRRDALPRDASLRAPSSRIGAVSREFSADETPADETPADDDAIACRTEAPARRRGGCPAPLEQGDPWAAAAENPFAEQFAEEEIIIDPYIACEPRLFAAVPAVSNKLDPDFADQLAIAAGAPGSRAAAEPAGAASGAEANGRLAGSGVGAPSSSLGALGNRAGERCGPAAETRTGAECIAARAATGRSGVVCSPAAGSAPRSDAESSEVRIDPAHAGLGEPALLVVEEEGDRPLQVVPSRQFRKLFSALESGRPLAPQP
jgi:type II secretory pathway predicted ATPase ExeA